MLPYLTKQLSYVNSDITAKLAPPCPRDHVQHTWVHKARQNLRHRNHFSTIIKAEYHSTSTIIGWIDLFVPIIYSITDLHAVHARHQRWDLTHFMVGRTANIVVLVSSRYLAGWLIDWVEFIFPLAQYQPCKSPMLWTWDRLFVAPPETEIKRWHVWYDIHKYSRCHLKLRRRMSLSVVWNHLTGFNQINNIDSMTSCVGFGENIQ